jgi:Lipocalin-like domain
MPGSLKSSSLIGAWRLQSWSLIYSDGRAPEYPLGEDAKGLIMYTPGGQVSATLMRGQRATEAPTSQVEKATAYADSFAYAGSYEVRGGTVFHTIEIATNPALIGLTSTRHITLEGDTLTLEGPDFSAGSQRTQQIVWRRVNPATT